MEFFEKQISSKSVYKGYIVNIRSDIAELKDGKMVVREVVEHAGGVAVVPVDEHGRVLMVRQYRYPMGMELLEVPAGKLEAGEDPYECAVRELSEETGCTAGKMISLGKIYTSPGFSTEILHLYLATELIGGEMHLDEGEFLSVEAVPAGKLVEMIMSGEIKDAKTIIGVLKAVQILENTD